MNTSLNKQRGVALVAGLVLLLVMTMIGIIAIRNSTQQGRMSGSYQQQTQAFQSAESAIRLVSGQVNRVPGINLPLATRNLDLASQAIQSNITLTAEQATPPAIPAGAANLVASTASAGGSGFNASANFYSTGVCGDGSSPCPMIEDSSMNKYSGFSFEINAVANQPRTFARSNNIQGLTYLAPRQQN